MSNIAIKAKNLSKTFGDGKQAVKNVNLEIKEGEIYGFLGPNGAGKSTIIKMLVTLLEPTNGDAEILGNSILKNYEQIRLDIGVALQEAALDEQQTGHEILWMQGRLYGLTKQEIESRLKDLRKLIDIGDSLDERVKKYSGGMKRRLDLAAALIHNPKILFLDEPTTGLDPISRSRVWEEVRRLNDELGMTIFLTTQYLEEADELADRVGIISGGEIVAEGTPGELKNELGNDTIVVKTKESHNEILETIKKYDGVVEVNTKKGETSIGVKEGSKVIGKIAIEFEKNNIELEKLILRTTTLDDVFLDVTGNRIEDSHTDGTE